MRVRSSRNAKLKQILYTTSFFVVVILIGFAIPRVFSFVSSVVMAPVHGISQWYETSDSLVPALLRDRNELLDQINTLENDLVVAQGQDLTFRRLQDENNRLRSLLSIEEQERVAANVLARPTDLPYDLLQIDQGSQSDIVEGTLVYVGEDQLIGVVSHVSFDYSLVTLFTTPGAEMTGFISGPDVIATVEGVGAGVARVRVPQGIPLTIGDLVYVPSVQPGLFGQIDYIESRPSQPEQFGYITLPTALHSLHEVAIAQQPVEPATGESVLSGQAMIIADLLLADEVNTVSFEELLATTTPTTTDAVNEEES